MTDRDEAADILKRGRKFVRGNTSTEYLLVHKTDSGAQIGRLEFNKIVQNEFQDVVADALTGYINNIQDGSLSVRELNAGNSLTDEALLQHVEEDNLPDTPLFQALTSPLQDYPETKYERDHPPDFQLIRVSDGSKALIGVQNHQSLQTYNSSSSGIPLFYTNSVYEKFDGDLLIVPESLNAVYFDGHVFVRTPKSFEKMFDMREEYEKKARAVIDGFESSGIRFAEDKVRDEWLAKGDIRILRKLYSVHENEIPKYATPDKMEEIIDKYSLSVSSYRENGEIELDINQYTDVWQLLRLLNSDYAEAELIPGAKLEIESKRFMD